MDSATLQALLSVLRGMLIATGAVSSYLSDELVTEITSALLVLLPLMWGAWNGFSAERKAKAREVVAVNVGIAVADATPGPTLAVPAVLVPSLLQTIAPIVRKTP